MSADSKMIAVLKLELAALKGRVELLESQSMSAPEPAVPAKIKAKRTKKERDPDAPKGEPNAWIKFTSRVNVLLNENDAKLPGAEQKQFCSLLKDNLLAELKKLDDTKKMLTEDDYASIDSEMILTERKSWVKPETGKWKASHPEGSGSNKSSRKSSNASSTKSAADEATADAHAAPDAEVVAAAAAAAPKKRGRPAGAGAGKKTKETAAPAPTVVAKTEPVLPAWDEADEAEEVIDDVELVTVAGKEYYKSEFNDLFDSDSMAYVGVLNGKKILTVPAEPRVTVYLAKASE